MTPFDIDSLVQPRIEKPDEEYDYSAHGGFIGKCDSYSEYLLKCCIEGIEPLITADEFEAIKNDCSVIGFWRSGAVQADMTIFSF